MLNCGLYERLNVISHLAFQIKMRLTDYFLVAVIQSIQQAQQHKRRTRALVLGCLPNYWFHSATSQWN